MLSAVGSWLMICTHLRQAIIDPDTHQTSPLLPFFLTYGSEMTTVYKWTSGGGSHYCIAFHPVVWQWWLASSSTWASETIAISTRMYCRIQPSLATSFSWNVCHCTVWTICEEYRPLLQFLIRLGATCIHFSLHKTDKEVVRLYSALQIKSNHVCKSFIPISFLRVKLLSELAKIPTSKIVYCTHTHT